MSSPGSSGSGGLPKPQKSKRKISLPWFRGSVAAHPTLTRQHTIDTPSSFQARLLRRQPSQNAMTGVLEMTWVVSDFTACGSQELTVTKGQQVEVVEVCPSRPDYCLVRMPTRGTDHDTSSGGGVPEGLVPLAVLKQPPQPRSSPSRRIAADHENEPAPSSNEGSTINTSSPVNKRRGFSGRKWLPPQLRKLSQGKVEKTQSTADRPPLKKTGSDKRIKVPNDMGNKPSVSEGEDEEERTVRINRLTHEIANGGGEDVDDEVELPPPMKPIQEPILVGGGATTSAVPPIEENPSKREQHTENQERNSLLRDAKPDGLSDSENAHKELSAQCSSNDATTAYSGDESDNKHAEEGSSSDAKETHLEKRSYVMQELIETEQKYVQDLALIIDGYIPTMKDENCEIPMPDDLKSGKDKMVFGNIENIYSWHNETFLKELQKCLDHPAELGPLFKRCERKLHMYVVYCKNKPVSEFIVSEHLDTYFEELRIHLGHKLQICDLLIKPVQRIMKYQLLLKDLHKHTERAGLEQEAKMLREALHVMTVVPKSANDMMDVGRLQGFEGKITAQGKLLLNGALIVTDLNTNSNVNIGKNKELHVFLFEQSIIFSESSGRKNQFTSPKYYYKTHIQMNKMDMKPEPSEPLSFILKSTDPNRSMQMLQCQAPSAEMYAQWESTIDAILQSQTNFLKAIQSPIAYQNQLTRDSSPFAFEIPTPNPARYGMPPPPPTSGKKSINPIQHANTISIPSDAELMAKRNKDTKEHRKSKRILNGLFGKHKSESTMAVTDGNSNEDSRRWSESSPATYDNHVMAPGTQARLINDHSELSSGEIVTVIRYDSTQGYLVRTNSNSEQEAWLPAQVLSNGNRKAWSFRFRKPSFPHGRRSIDASTLQDNLIPEVSCPDFIDKIQDTTVICGDRAVLSCFVKPCGRACQITWRKIEPDPCVMRHGGRFQLSQLDGNATLTINNVRNSDSGTYICIAANEIGSAQCSANLVVSEKLPFLKEPKIQVISSASVLLEWENDTNRNQQYLVEYCKIGTGEWLSPNNDQPLNSLSYTVERLIPGEAYSFRIVTIPNRQVSLHSVTVTLPVADNLRWQQEQFKRRYIECEELDRGRFSIVRKAQDRGTGQEVALKQIFRRRQPHKVTQAEYTLLAGMQHPNIIHAMALFDNAPVPGIDTIVLEIVRGVHLYNYLIQSEVYSELEVCDYSRQLISALAWLHRQNLAHLDVKPENVMLDISNASHQIKLIDFGDCVNTAKSIILPPACLEFASPELVLGQPVGKHTDYWAVGVFLYVLLSGVSPFLDDSVEETTTNILKCDYCFPDEYFCNVSIEAKDLISRLLCLMPTQRINMEDCLELPWLKNGNCTNLIPSTGLKTFIIRRNPMHSGASLNLLSPTSKTLLND